MDKAKNRKTYYILSIAILLIAVIGFSFAYFLGTFTNTAGIDVSLRFDDYIFETSHDVDEVELNIDALSMFGQEEDVLVGSADQKINFSLTNLDGQARVCTYDLLWVWDSAFDQYNISQSGIKEFTITAGGPETQLPNYSSNETVISSGTIAAVSEGYESVKTENITLKFYNLANVDQAIHAGKNYKGTVKVGNVLCETVEGMEKLSDTVLALESNDDYTSKDDGTIYRVANQNGVRYEGANPDNYVEYNGELWRIIGTFNGSDMNLDPNKEYTKIIKATPIGKYYWDTGGKNDWENASLNTYLNGEYFASLSEKAQSMVAKYNGEYSLWHLRGTNHSTYQTLYASGWYDIERTTGIAGYKDGVYNKASPEKTAAIGLMYPSDYGYAAYGSTCNNESTETLNSYSGVCSAVDWLMYLDSTGVYKNEWMITPYSASAYEAYYLGVQYANGSLVYYRVNDASLAVRPTLYLDAEVYQYDGDGSEDDPYKLVRVTEIKTLSDTVLALERNEDYTSNQDGSIYRVVDQNGVRYEGKNPDNYVYYNCTDESDTSTCELWRIIGTFNGSDMNLDPNKKYTKIVRSTQLETNMAWNSTSPYENDWVRSTLNAYLNGEYLGKLSTTAQGQIAKYNNKYSLWHLRGADFDSDTPETLYAAGWYDIERNTGTSGYRNGIEGAADAAKEYAIGLMYPSDYGYAAYGSSCNNENTESLYEYKVCAAVDWLVDSGYSGWVISPGPGYDSAFYVAGGDGGYVYIENVRYEQSVRPTLYLEADVLVKDGNGSEDSPYELYYEAPPMTLSDTVLALESENDYTSSQDGSIYRVVNQNGVRYEGKKPDNYVYYNCTDESDTSTCELWRIIGTFNGSDMNLNPSKKYTKIVRSTPLETEMVWDADGENDWVNSTLNAYLNGEYLSSLSTTAQGMIATYNSEYSLWHLRGIEKETSYTLYASGWYEIERNTGTSGYRGGVAGAADAAKEAAIGLMYPSDYGYAAYGTACNNESTETLFNYEGSCEAVDWLLYDGWEWLISPLADYSDSAFSVYGFDGGYVSDAGYSVGDIYLSVRPTLYLSSEVEIVGGNGSEETPYILINGSEI